MYWGHPSLVAVMKTSGLKGECLSRISVVTPGPRPWQSPHLPFWDDDRRLAEGNQHAALQEPPG